MSALKPRTTTVPIFQGDDLDPIEDLRRKVEEAGVRQDTAQGVADAQREGSPRLMGDTSAVDELRAATSALRVAAMEYDLFLEAATERGEAVVLQAVGRKRWRDLLKQNPPRKVDVEGEDGKVEKFDDEEDAMWGFDYSTLGDSLVPESAVDKTVHDEAFFDSLSDGDWSRIYSTAIQLNQGGGPDPKARLSSRLAQTSGATSE